MLGRLFPRQFDNVYRGHVAGLWLFVPIMLVKALQSVESIVRARTTAINADGIPLDTFPPAAAGEVVTMFALLGLYLLVIPVQSAVVLARYRSMVPFMYLSLLMLQISTRVLHMFIDPPATGGHAIGFYINLGIMAVTIVGFVLSLLPGKSARAN